MSVINYMNTSVLSFNKNIVIIGAGIGGLVTALSLQKSGVRSKIYESKEQNKESGAGIILSINAMKVLARLGVTESIMKQGHVVSEVSLASPNGRILSSNDLTSNNFSQSIPSVAIHRKKLHKILAEKLHDGVIEYSKKCVSVDDEKKVCLFDDGEQLHFDLLIGCDGINSIVRTQIGLNQTSRDANQICYRGTLTIDNTRINKGKFIETWGNGKRFGLVNISEKDVYWYATLSKHRFSEIASNEAKAVLTKEFSDWWGPISEIIRSQEESSILRNDLYDRKPISTWSVENVVLLGDAIHATTPNMGQGAAMAIESAAVLSECLTKIDRLSSALSAYQNHRAARTRKVTQLSWKIGQTANMRGELSCAIRNALFRAVPDRVLNNSANEFFNATMSIEQ